MWRCPSDPSRQLTKQGDNTEFHASYSVNAWFEYGNPESRVDQPAAKIYLLESTDDDHFHWWEMGHEGQTYPILPLDQLPPKQLNEQVAMNRHSGGAEYLYADWHGKWSHFAPLWGVMPETNAFWP